MKRTKHIVNILTAAVTLLLTASCNVSYPDLDLPQGEPPTNDEDVNIDKTSILLYTSNPAYFSVVSDTRGSVGTRGTGAFEPMETVAYNRDKYLNAKFHIFAFRAYNDADPNGGQGVLTEEPSMSRYRYAQDASGGNMDEYNTSCLLDGPEYKLGMPFKFEPDQFIGTMNVLTKDYPEDIYYSSRYQDVGYNFFGYFVDDLDLSNYTREKDKITYDIEIDGYQDVLVGAAKTPLTEADFAEGGIYEKAARLTEEEKQKILNTPGNYSTFAAHRNVHPVVNMKHQLTMLKFFAYPGASSAKDVVIKDINNKKFTAPDAANNTKSGLATTADGTIAYYPVSGNYDFWGYRVDDAAGATPVVKTVDDTGAEVEANVATKRVVDIEIDGSQDIMAGKAAPSNDEVTKLGGYAENFYSAYAARKGVQPNITFNHLLTRFTFEVRAGSKATAGAGASGNTEAVRVKGISVESLTNGTLTVAYTGETKQAADLLTFTGDASALTLKQRATTAASNNDPLVDLVEVPLTWPAAGEATVGDVISVGEALLVAPGKTEYPLTIALAQKVKKNTADTDKTDMNLEQKATIKMDGVKAFEPGKSYKVTITVYGLEEIEVTATLVPWADGGSIDIDDDRDPNNGKYTEPTVTPAP